MPTVAIITADDAASKTLEAALGGERTSLAACRDLPALSEQLAGGQIVAAIVDIDPQPRDMLRQIGVLTVRWPQVRFVVLATQSSGDMILEAMRLGARDYVIKSSLQSELATLARRVVPDEANCGGEGIAILSCGGGCGGTTLAVNLATEVGLAIGKPALLVDLDCYCGAVSTYLGLQGSYGLADLLADPARVDADLVRSTTLTYSPTLEVLQSPSIRAPLARATVSPQALMSTLAACKAAYACTVVDAPRADAGVATALAEACETCVLVVQLTIRDLRAARILMDELDRRGVSAARLVLAANRSGRHKGLLSLADAAVALGRNSFVELSNDFDAASRAFTMGRPLAQVAPRSDLRRDIQRLAKRLLPTAAGRARAA